MNTTISQTVDQWIEKESYQNTLALRVIRQNDPWQDMPEEEVEDRREFIRCYLLRDMEILLMIPIQPRENDFWFANHQEFMESAFNTYDFQKDRIPFDKYSYRLKKVLEQIKDMAILHSCISQQEGRNNIHKRYQSIVENEFRRPLLNLLDSLNKATDKEKRLEIFHRILEIHKRIHQSKLVWEKLSPYEE